MQYVPLEFSPDLLWTIALSVNCFIVYIVFNCSKRKFHLKRSGNNPRWIDLFQIMQLMSILYCHLKHTAFWNSKWRNKYTIEIESWTKSCNWVWIDNVEIIFGTMYSLELIQTYKLRLKHITKITNGGYKDLQNRKCSEKCTVYSTVAKKLPVAKIVCTISHNQCFQLVYLFILSRFLFKRKY